MPLFYFDTYDDDCAVPDGQGLVLSDLKEAKEEAIKALPDMARDGLPMEITASSWSMSGTTGTKLARGS